MRPELPYLAAGLISVAGAVRAERGWPPNLTRSVIGTAVLVIVASMSTDTKLAPLVRAIGLLFAMAAVFAAVRSNSQPGKSVGKAAGTAIQQVASKLKRK